MLLSTLTVNNKNSHSSIENLLLPIQMQLSDKQKTFSATFIPFLEYKLIFKNFEKKGFIDQVFLKLLTSKNLLA